MDKNVYSPSRIGAFAGCKLKYKYQYIDKLKSDIEAIETFRGGIVHKVLEDFYRFVKNGSVKPLEWVTDKYKELWDKNYTDSIKIARKDVVAEDYYNKGYKGVVDYYNKYKPFSATKIVDTERSVKFSIKKGSEEYKFRGILDRLDWNDNDNIFEIHDYKVTNSLMTQEEADNNWQLGIYHIALKEKWPDAVNVKLVWHSILFNKEIVSFRTKEQLEELKDDLVKKVDEIEGCKEYLPEKSVLCDWCDFQNICPLWKHVKEVSVLPVNEYMKETGVKLVAKYAKLEEKRNELKEEIYEIEEDQEKIKEAVIEYAEKNKVAVIDGPGAQLKVDIKEEIKVPSKAKEAEAQNKLREFLIAEGKYEEASDVSNRMINYQIKNRNWPEKFIKKIMKYLNFRVTKRVKLIKKKEEK